MKTINHLKTLVVFLLITFNTGARTAWCQSAMPPEIQDRLDQENWLTADLKLDNRLYAATRAAIDKRIRQGEKPANLERLFQMQGKEIYDPQKIFRWSYAAYRAQKIETDQNFLLGIRDAMDRNLKPGAYDWVRLRFLVASLQSFLRPTPQLIVVGRRLLKVRYDDPEVMYQWISNLSFSQSLDERKLGLALARDEVQKHPRDGRWQLLAADAVDLVLEHSVGITDLSYKDIQWEIAEYKKALALLPVNHTARKGIIRRIVSRQLLYNSKGEKQLPSQATIDNAIKNTNLR